MSDIYRRTFLKRAAFAGMTAGVGLVANMKGEKTRKETSDVEEEKRKIL